MYKAIDREHGLDDFDAEEKWVDPVVVTGILLVFLSVVCGFLFELVKYIFR